MKNKALDRIITDLNKVDEEFMIRLYDDLVAERLKTELVQSLVRQPAGESVKTLPAKAAVASV